MNFGKLEADGIFPLIESLDFEKLLEIVCFSNDETEKNKAAELLERQYCFEIRCSDMDRTVRFAHHGRGCVIIAAKICKGVVIFQNVTIGTNARFNKVTEKWENVGNPIIAENVVICDGAKILGPVTIGANSVVAAGAIVTKDVPENSVVYGVNKCKPRNPNVDLVFSQERGTPSVEEIIETNKKRVEEFMNKNERNKL